jgi:hypothetical protein
MSVKIELFHYCRLKILQQFGDGKIQLCVQKSIKYKFSVPTLSFSVSLCYRVEYLNVCKHPM